MNTAKVPLLEWDQRYAVDNDIIDREHQTWFALINGVHLAMLDGAARNILRTVLAEATQYAFIHFTNEERLMEESSYPELAAHAAQHAELLRQTRAFSERLDAGDTATLLEFLVFLADWARHHTSVVDRRLGAYLNAHQGE